MPNNISNIKKRLQNLELILDSITDGVFTLDSKMNFTYVNNAFEEICKCSREEFIGFNYWKKFPKAVELKFYEEYSTVLKSGVSSHFDEYATSLDKWVSVNVYPNDGGLTVFFTDISEKVNQLSTIQIQNDKLLDIANILSHEIRKPVATILGLFQLVDFQNYERLSNREILFNMKPVIEELNKMISDANERAKQLKLDE